MLANIVCALSFSFRLHRFYTLPNYIALLCYLTVLQQQYVQKLLAFVVSCQLILISIAFSPRLCSLCTLFVYIALLRCLTVLAIVVCSKAFSICCLLLADFYPIQLQFQTSQPLCSFSLHTLKLIYLLGLHLKKKVDIIEPSSTKNANMLLFQTTQ